MSNRALQLVRSVPHDRSYSKGIAAFVVAAVFYSACQVASYLVPDLAFRAAAAILCGLAIGLMFIVGHDACHDALVPNRRMNKVLGTVAMIPSLHAYSAWAYSHNVLHHTWTNLAGVDPVYAPLSLRDYQRMSAYRRTLERFERSALGMGLLYFRRIWVPYMLLPTRARQVEIRRMGPFRVEQLLLILYLVVHLTVAVALAQRQAGSWITNATLNLLIGFVLPQAVWNWLMGAVTYLHHTHPSLRWYSDRAEWRRNGVQTTVTVHVRLPVWIDMLLFRIMQHPAHHVDPRLPFYLLPRCQDALNPITVSYDLTFKSWKKILKSCHLYDYEKHKWRNFGGQYTSPEVGV